MNHMVRGPQIEWDGSQLRELADQLTTIRTDMIGLEASFEAELARSHPAYQSSARNLVHYLALRRHDVRDLQQRLAALGLSSLGRAEAHVMATLDQVLKVLHHLMGLDWKTHRSAAPAGLAEGNAELEAHTRMLLGPSPQHRAVRIMVTMSTEAADDYALVRDLVKTGMDCMRINCAHDGSEQWGRMVEHCRKAESELGKRCLIEMDLAGPKLRTGPIEPGPRVISWHPERNSVGEVTAPARVFLRGEQGPAPLAAGADGCLPAPREWLSRLRAGSRIEFIDARGASRKLKVVEIRPEGCWAECRQTAYVTSGIALNLCSDAPHSAPLATATVGELPPIAQPLILKPGDTLILTRSQEVGAPAVHYGGQLVSTARVACTLPEVFQQVCAGEMIWFDDGKIGGVIRRVADDRNELEVEITLAKPSGEKLAADKGINLPESRLRLPAMTEKDLQDLPFVAAHADLVGMSFVRRPQDVYDLQQHLAQLSAGSLGIVLKIETRDAFENLPNLLLAAMRHPSTGVMIARGDLGVECGFERLAEVQEEILWFCEAAHLPVIWATQVLENLAKKGQPSRAEISDAAMGERAECVMLNKGPHIVKAVGVLDDILRRMQSHQSKKTSRLRPLHVSEAGGAARPRLDPV